MNQPVDVMPVIDGFLYNPRLLYAPCRSLPLLREQLMFCNNHSYQPRFYLAPADYNVPIMAGLTSRTQLRMVPGSVIIGLRFATLGGVAASNMSYLLEDSNQQNSEGSSVFIDGQDRFIGCQALQPSGASGAAFCFLNEPYRVGGGVITAALSNLSTSTDIRCQLFIYVMEPLQSQTTTGGGSVLLPTMQHLQTHYQQTQRYPIQHDKQGHPHKTYYKGGQHKGGRK